ncbi:MAG: glycosyltransferase 9 family protein [Micavibrio aeruginosavorus]|uniref:Glycosyltransferase 9 family protein n=1 Tax=Micavibrio aeruginosavorus TaxID=349221 RepID=A0A2W5FIY5_9BACT|nr:MAG: glycosyltransferase 9 family protein [Micavibrio aeruginosavorus]
MSEKSRILVIKLGALGDFMYALGPMRAIRDHHKDAHITLLTQKPYVGLANKTGFFDDIILDARPKYNPADWLSFRKRLNDEKFTRVYDLQNNDRTSLYFKLFSPRPEWSGIAKGASHRNTDPERQKFHAFIGHRNTLRLAGIENTMLDPLEWMQSDISRFNLKKPYALLIPGSAPSRPNKRWPAENYHQLAQKLIAAKIQPVIIGSNSETALSAEISQGLDVVNITGQTDLNDIPALAREAIVAIGNDTGPMHMVSMTGCPSIMFFRSDESTIEKHGPQNPASQSFESDNLNEISIDKVFAAIEKIAL